MRTNLTRKRIRGGRSKKSLKGGRFWSKNRKQETAKLRGLNIGMTNKLKSSKGDAIRSLNQAWRTFSTKGERMEPEGRRRESPFIYDLLENIVLTLNQLAPNKKSASLRVFGRKGRQGARYVGRKTAQGARYVGTKTAEGARAVGRGVRKGARAAARGALYPIERAGEWA